MNRRSTMRRSLMLFSASPLANFTQFLAQLLLMRPVIGTYSLLQAASSPHVLNC